MIHIFMDVEKYYIMIFLAYTPVTRPIKRLLLSILLGYKVDP